MSARRIPQAERETHYRLMRQVYALCRSGEWRVEFRTDAGNKARSRKKTRWVEPRGEVDDELGIIKVDAGHDLIATFLHECIHIILSERNLSMQDEEAEVQRLELLMMRRLTPIQARRVLHQIDRLLNEK